MNCSAETMAFCCTAFNIRTQNSCGTLSPSTLETFTKASRLSNPLRHLSFSPDGALFASLAEVRYSRHPSLISSTIKPSRFGTEFRLQLYQTFHSSICRFPVLSCTCSGSFLSISNSAILPKFGLMGLGTWRMCFSQSLSIIPSLPGLP